MTPKFEVRNPEVLSEPLRERCQEVTWGLGGLSRGVARRVQFVESSDFPAAYKPEALAGCDILNVLRGEQELDWTFLSPSVEYVPLRAHQELPARHRSTAVGAQGESKISYEEDAIALVDKLETRDIRQSFTVGY